MTRDVNRALENWPPLLVVPGRLNRKYCPFDECTLSIVLETNKTLLRKFPARILESMLTLKQRCRYIYVLCKQRYSRSLQMREKPCSLCNARLMSDVRGGIVRGASDLLKKEGYSELKS